MRIHIAQLDLLVGDVPGNLRRLREARAKAASVGAELVMFPELALSGYPPEDLILRPAFRAACREAAFALAEDTKDGGPAALVGTPWEEHGNIYNAALLLDGGEIVHIHRKVELPNYAMFDEKRLFTPGPPPEAAHWRGRRLGIMVCEDMWRAQVPRLLAADGAEIFLSLNASPFEVGKPELRRALAAEVVQQYRLPLVYGNLTGAQDDIIFDGGSFIMDAGRTVASALPHFTEAVGTGGEPNAAEPLGLLWEALVTGLRGYVRKNGFPGVLLGLSGGIDSALAAALAVDALGANNVLGVLLPSPHTSNASNEDALSTAQLLGIETRTVPILPGMDALKHMLDAAMAQPGWFDNLAVGGNIQSRLRGITLMALSNATGRMLVNTGNKSEVAMGYTTLYGDSCGGYAPLKDVYKTDVYALARWRNAQGEAIPQGSIDKAPTAELAPGQKDEDQLPPYPVLDQVLRHHIEGGMGVEEMVVAGIARELAERVASALRASEFKRRQMPPGARVSSMMFGRDWRYPLTSGFKG